MVSEVRSKLIPITGALKDYAWGLPATESFAAALHEANGADKPDPTRPAAELWLGTHPSGPAHAKSGGTLAAAVGADLPFLLKVLSVARPLSIQAHPDKIRAAKLHAARPDKYKDDNHKPEMCVALTPFEGMCNFRPAAELADALAATQPLSDLIGDAAKSFNAASGADELQAVFAALMRADPADVGAALNATLSLLDTRPHTPADDLFLRLHNHYPGDVGCFCAYLLNHVRLAPGEALYMGANEPHAYLSGQCVEIMACSDNVVRAGLTPKFKDVEALVEMLTYRAGAPDTVKPAPHQGGTLYRPGPQEFQLVRYALPPHSTVELPRHNHHGILLVTDGAADVFCSGVRTQANTGFAACLADATAATLTAGPNGATVFRASANQVDVAN